MKRLRDGFWPIVIGYIAIVTAIVLSIAQQNQIGAVTGIACMIVLFAWWPKFPEDNSN